MKLIVVIALVLAAVGCAGTETGNPSFDGSVGYDAYSSAPGVVALPAGLTRPTRQLELEHAWLVLGEVELIPRGHCDANDDGDAHVPGLGPGDHAGGQAPATHTEMNSGLYCGARLPFVNGSASVPAAAPSALRDHAIVLDGTLADGRRFELQSASAVKASLRASGAGFPMDAMHPGVVFGFDVATWLGELDWGVVPDEMVMIDAEHNPELLQAFEARVASGVALFRDDDEDGLLDAEPVLLAD